MTDSILDYYNEHQKAFNAVYGQMKHLGYKNWDCGCKRSAATAVLTSNYPRDVESEQQQITSRAVAVGASYSDPIRVAAMLIHTEPWDQVIIVGDRHGPLYDNLPTVKTPSELPQIDSFDPEKRTLIVFGKCSETNSKRDRVIIENFFIRGRLRGIFTLYVECIADMIPGWIRKITDTLYLTSPPDKRMKQLFNFRVPVPEAPRNSWLKVDLRNDESEVIDASKYYP